MFDTKADYASQSAIPGLHDDEIESRVLSRILLRQAERHGSRTFIDVCGRATSFEDMLDVSWRLANGLRSLGVSRSDRVAMLLPNCFELVATWFALSNLGAIEVPTNPGLKGDLLCHNLNNCGAEVLVADAGALTELARVQEHLPDVRTLVLVGADPGDARAAGVKIGRIVRFEECLATPSAPDLATIHYSDPMAILYTSGTTGPAKGALMSHHHCYSWAAAMAANLGYTTQDSYFSALPLFHTDAQMFGVYLPLIYGTRATLVEGFSASRFWEQVRGSGATATNLLGAMAVILMRAPPGKDDRGNPVRVCQCIPMVPDKEAFECRFGMRLVTGYGQTETGFVALDTVDATRPGSCGKPHPDWEVAVVDGRDRPVPPGTVGEIVSRPRKSWSMFSGYYRADAKTVQALRNLWYHSGDAGFMDEDGWLYFKHRLNEAIRRRGENISAYEVETLAEEHPDVVESAAFGMPSEFTEEDIMVVVSRRSGSTLTPADLLDHFRARAPRHMVPRYLEITDAPLPRTPTEKIARSILQHRGITPDTFDRGSR
ncbi:AMP-binding protein [Sinorhizobium medicae]|uniref:ATP-dependent acyl-CoA ligase n=2 Tax=Sinorhizobium medicae TaxID=110321 RepID=A0A508X7Y1_9HYPH|nr:AMP-binding protein [Sinorhizobium medicae]MDX0521968.1 AMP-binding protein [Sinorhizobium medicae]MDX0633785.1 AMP-binding protein [Sinorhizobium medicae]MDX0694352.1 AMP-binding protein [Sinorhizobium medicae]MDX0743535.1 AMP-binding protein [Sinorhizobium medicae]VTZ65064.1 ATP-dependent acyl-CoA ligase [Sinorhizobium medicae]